MSREQFEKWYEEEYGTEFGQDYCNDTTIEKGFMAGYQAATEAAQPKWIPYKKGDSLDEGEYYVTIRANSGQIYARHKWFRWGDWNGLEQYETVTYVIQLPAPFVPEVSE